VTSTGLSALVNALSAADTARFLKQHGSYMGDYTDERKEMKY